jgi:general secretion pathway protein N
MIATRKLVGLAVAACSAVATTANVGLAAKDPRGLGGYEDQIDRPATPMLSPDVASPIPSATVVPFRGNPLWGISLQSLRATRERPLFTPSRRPPMPAVIAPRTEPVETVSAVVEPEQPPLNLLGIVTGAAEGYAVFVNTATHDIVRLKTGEGHDGWILQSVSGRAAVLEKNHRTATVSLPLPDGGHK